MGRLLDAGHCLSALCHFASRRCFLRLRPLIRQRTIAYLQSPFDREVQFSSFQASLYPRVHIVVDGIVLRHFGRTDIPPLIQIQKLTVDTVGLDELQIHTPPRQQGSPPRQPARWQKLARLRAEEALLVILPTRPEKPPRVFPIHQLELQSLALNHPAVFHAMLSNPKPLGEIEVTGEFGSWDSNEPSLTPVSARYTFTHADLGTLQRIEGILASQGEFRGPLDYLQAEGETDTPDFGLRVSSHPLALHTNFSAIVDGRNGDTTLRAVYAHFLRSWLYVSSDIVESAEAKGRRILLDAVSDDAWLEDLLRLAVKADQPPMTGRARLSAKIEIPRAKGTSSMGSNWTGNLG